jgi:threonine/homoserine/homoserine lactone efflux protein
MPGCAHARYHRLVHLRRRRAADRAVTRSGNPVRRGAVAGRRSRRGTGVGSRHLKFAGAAYLVWLGIRTIREANAALPVEAVATGARRALRDGIIVEAFNPKTAAFFLAFIPQFVDPAGFVALQFVVLGSIPVLLNSAVDVVVVLLASHARGALGRRPSIVRRLRQGSGVAICSLGAVLAIARRPT